ncbi:phage tail-collar fiber domain-containing protein [Providencia hangzhouensis]
MASIITVAFENWKAQEAASGKAVLLDEFVFANVPNLDPTQPIDRNEKLPPANQIVHRQAVNKAGLASENAVAYSVTLGAEVGNFDFNWIGLLNKASGTVAMITHAPTQKKLKNQNGQQGNVLTRSFILEFQGAAEETQIKTSAETWQIDFTARLSGIDEMQRLINVDSYGAAAFFNDGFEVIRSGEQYTVKKGLGYVGGLRGELAQNQILNGLRNTKVYADFSYQGNIVSRWNTVVKITAAATLANYVDAAGFTHQVFAIASIDASGNVKDLRSMGALSSQEISALETRLKLDLSKKIDKANITHQMGNSTELVVSQQLLATELGKKQPAGNYAPAGDYATKSELKNGLDGKLNTSSPEAENRLTVKSTGDYAAISLKKNSNNNGERVDIETMPNANNSSLNIIYRDKYGRNVSVTSIPKKTGTTMLVGDFGWGATKKENSIKETDFGINKHRTFGVFYHDSDAKNTPNGHQYGGGISFGRDPAVSTHMLYSPDWSNRLYMRSPKSASTMNPWVEFYSTENAVTDRNGLLRISANDELSDYPVGAPIPWPQATAPAGFLVCNGQSFNKTTYPLLAKAYPTGVLPDLRGEFIRGVDYGRGIDANRTVLSAQGDAFRAHNHSVIGEDSGSGTAYFGRGNGSRRTISKNAMNLEGGTETRPRNIAFLYIVRAA